MTGFTDVYDGTCKADDDSVLAHRNKVAEERGCTVVYPLPNQLFVDIDDYESLGIFHANVNKFPGVSFHKVSLSASRKSGRYHAVVTLERPVKDEFERIALQLILGSDRAREAIAWKRCVAGVSRPTCFFEPKMDKAKQAEAAE